MFPKGTDPKLDAPGRFCGGEPLSATAIIRLRRKHAVAGIPEFDLNETAADEKACGWVETFRLVFSKYGLPFGLRLFLELFFLIKKKERRKSLPIALSGDGSQIATNSIIYMGLSFYNSDVKSEFLLVAEFICFDRFFKIKCTRESLGSVQQIAPRSCFLKFVEC